MNARACAKVPGRRRRFRRRSSSQDVRLHPAGTETFHHCRPTDVVRRVRRAPPPQGIHPVTETVIGTLIGIKMDEGKLRGLDATPARLLPAYSRVVNRQMAAITLRQLLTMTSDLPPPPEG